MSNKFIDSIRHVIIEDDDPKTAAKSQPQPTPAAKAASDEGASGVSSAVSASAGSQPLSEETERAYQRILAKTNFESTAIATIIHKYLDPLKAISNLDERTRFKTAVVQARAQEGLTEEKILATFDGLKIALRNEQESFAASAQTTRQREVVERQKRVQETTEAIAQKQKEIAQLQQQLSAMSSELGGAQSRIERAESQFNAAAQRRAAEIDQEKARYLGLLQG